MTATNSADGQSTDAPPRPIALPVLAEIIPSELRNLNQWVVWKYVLRDGKWTKPPFSAHDGRSASSIDPTTWAPFQVTLTVYERERGRWDGVGMIHLPNDLLTVVDLDHVRDPVSGVIAAWAMAIVIILNSYTEISPSGTGLRIVCGGAKPGRLCVIGHFEMYDGVTAEGKAGGRYLTFTGHHLEDTPLTINDRQEQINKIYSKYLEKPKSKARKKPKVKKVAAGKKEPVADGHQNSQGDKSVPFLSRIFVRWEPPDGPLSDDDFIKMAESDLDPLLTKLWKGDFSDYLHEDGTPDHSVGDCALVEKIAYWIGSTDEARIDRLFRLSKMYRDKWERDGYRRLTFDYLKGKMKPEDFRQSGGGQDEKAGSAPKSRGVAWKPPTPLSEPPAAPPPPVEVLPPALQELVWEVSLAMNCPADFILTAVLAMAGGAIGNSRHLSITRTHHQTPCIYAIIVGLPGAAKTPPLKLLRKPFDKLQVKYRDDFRRALLKWENADKKKRTQAGHETLRR